MKATLNRLRRSAWINDYGMALALVLLAGVLSWLTIEEQQPVGADAGKRLASRIGKASEEMEGAEKPLQALIIGRTHQESVEFVDALAKGLDRLGIEVADQVNGEPSDVRAALESLQQKGVKIDWIACDSASLNWGVISGAPDRFEIASGARILGPEPYLWPNFLKLDNLLNIADQISVIAILAIGMTLVIITAGIDLSVGSLIALSAVTTAWWIREHGGEMAGALTLWVGSGFGIVLCGGIGAFSGWMVTRFKIPPFIVTLSMMLVASGAAFIIAEGRSINEIPDGFTRLGRGSFFMGLPNAAALTLALYLVCHWVMSKTALGRYIYAVGGNPEASRLSGAPVSKTLMLVYTLSGALAGLGGVVLASQLKSGAPTYGLMYELKVIAAVVVGGASLMGGEGRVFGTLIGALIIAVIENGMNLLGVESYTQKVVLGGVILGAVALDRLKRSGGH